MSNLQQAIITAFSTNEAYVRKKTELEVLEDTLYGVVKDLSNEDKRLWTAIWEIKNKLAILEKQFADEKDGKHKFFRRK